MIDRLTVDQIHVRVVIHGIEIAQEIDQDHRVATIVTGKIHIANFHFLF